ncbi:aldo/keto reductase [Aquiflexum lacus]|uniref:aldo/keto reductase n=1 Tax=Aquiflexum lacus TaxID=2483805 RepID=UPI0018958B1A|nr:aldo/keto reductase [Aquiflexum lacus]
MKYNTIGKSGLITSNLTLGTMIFGENSERGTPKSEAIRLIDQFLDSGGNHIDTADVYANGESEKIVGEALRKKRPDVIISTKIRFRTESNPNAEGLSRWNLIQGVEKSLMRLETDYIDILYLHCFDHVTPLEETIATLINLIESGKVRYVGISNFKAWQLMKSQGMLNQLGNFRFIAAQYQYSLVKRDLEYEFFDLFADQGLGLLPWGPLGGGFLTGKYSKQGPLEGRIATSSPQTEESWNRRNKEKNWLIMDEITSLATGYGATASQIAIAWILSKKVVNSTIIGARTCDQLSDNLGANSIRLSLEDISKLDQPSEPEELYPYRMIADYGNRTF